MSAAVDFGLGLRPEHYEEIAANPGRVSWFEALSENYMVPGGMPLHWLDRLRRDYPMALHGVSLSIGSIDPLDRRYLDELKALVDRVELGAVDRVANVRGDHEAGEAHSDDGEDDQAEPPQRAVAQPRS